MLHLLPGFPNLWFAEHWGPQTYTRGSADARANVHVRTFFFVLFVGSADYSTVALGHILEKRLGNPNKISCDFSSLMLFAFDLTNDLFATNDKRLKVRSKC